MRTSSVANKEVPKAGPGGTLEFIGNSILEIADVEQFHLTVSGKAGTGIP